MVPERRSSAKSRMVSMGMRKSRITLMFVKSGRITPSVTLSCPAICGFMVACMEAKLKYWKIEKKK